MDIASDIDVKMDKANFKACIKQAFLLILVIIPEALPKKFNI